jgi:23S rRNA (cytidine1920-2'-O)/16S rRNA (cytidine1409-2'-O)-methyltransferase
VRDPAARQAVLAGITDFIATEAEWRVMGSIESPVAGGDGNVEYLLAAMKR